MKLKTKYIHINYTIVLFNLIITPKENYLN
jgi:hypothetical protein